MADSRGNRFSGRRVASGQESLARLVQQPTPKGEKEQHDARRTDGGHTFD